MPPLPRPSARSATAGSVDVRPTRRFLDFVADSRYLPAWVFLATTGCRRGECLGLRWGDLGLDAAMAIISRQVTTGDHELRIKELPKTQARPHGPPRLGHRRDARQPAAMRASTRGGRSGTEQPGQRIKRSTRSGRSARLSLTRAMNSSVKAGTSVWSQSIRPPGGWGSYSMASCTRREISAFVKRSVR